jgi:hypothetical protein
MRRCLAVFFFTILNRGTVLVIRICRPERVNEHRTESSPALVVRFRRRTRSAGAFACSSPHPSRARLRADARLPVSSCARS